MMLQHTVAVHFAVAVVTFIAAVAVVIVIAAVAVVILLLLLSF